MKGHARGQFDAGARSLTTRTHQNTTHVLYVHWPQHHQSHERTTLSTKPTRHDHATSDATTAPSRTKITTQHLGSTESHIIALSIPQRRVPRQIRRTTRTRIYTESSPSTHLSNDIIPPPRSTLGESNPLNNTHEPQSTEANRRPFMSSHFMTTPPEAPSASSRARTNPSNNKHGPNRPKPTKNALAKQHRKPPPRSTFPHLNAWQDQFVEQRTQPDQPKSMERRLRRATS